MTIREQMQQDGFGAEIFENDTSKIAILLSVMLFGVKKILADCGLSDNQAKKLLSH
jgi:hypothetical protein